MKKYTFTIEGTLRLPQQGDRAAAQAALEQFVEAVADLLDLDGVLTTHDIVLGEAEITAAQDEDDEQ